MTQASRTHTPISTIHKKNQGDLDWFDFETRMRKLISELLEPTVLRTQDDKNQILLLRKMNETLKKRMDDAEFMQSKAFKRMDKLEEVWARIKDLDNERLEDDAKMLEQMADFRKDLDSAKTHQENLEQQIKNLDLKNDKLNHSVEASNQLMSESKEEVFNMVARFKHDIEQQIKAVNEQIRELRDQQNENISKLSAHSEQLLEQNDVIQINKHHILDIGTIAKEAHEQVLTKTELEKHEGFVRLVNNNFKVLEEGLAKNALSANKENQRRLNCTLDYLHQKLPLEVQIQVSDTLNAVLAGRRDQLRLHKYERKYFANALGIEVPPDTEIKREESEEEEGEEAAKGTTIRQSVDSKSIRSVKSRVSQRSSTKGGEEEGMRETTSSIVPRKMKPVKQKKKRHQTREEYEESSGTSTQSDESEEEEEKKGEEENEEKEEKEEKEGSENGSQKEEKEEEVEKAEEEPHEYGGYSGGFQGSSIIKSSQEETVDVLNLLGERWELQKAKAKTMAEKETPGVIFKRLDRLHQKKREFREVKKQVAKLQKMQGEMRELKKKTMNLRGGGLGSAGSGTSGGGIEDMANDSGGFGMPVGSGRFGKLGSGRQSFLSKKTGSSAFGAGKKVTPRIFKKSTGMMKKGAASGEESEEYTERESEVSKEVDDQPYTQRQHESITEVNEEEQEKGTPEQHLIAGISLAETTVGEQGPKKSQRSSHFSQDKKSGTIQISENRISQAEQGREITEGQKEMRESGYLSIHSRAPVEQDGSLESDQRGQRTQGAGSSQSQRKSVASNLLQKEGDRESRGSNRSKDTRSMKISTRQRAEGLQAIREESKLMSPATDTFQTTEGMDMAGKVINQFPMPGEVDNASETLTLGQGNRGQQFTTDNPIHLMDSEDGGSAFEVKAMHGSSQQMSEDTLLDQNLLNGALRQGHVIHQTTQQNIVQVVKQEVEPEVWQAHEERILEIVEDRIYTIFEEKFSEMFEPSFGELYEEKFGKDFQEAFQEKFENEVQDFVGEKWTELNEIMEQRLGEVEQQFMQVGGHFDQLQSKMKTQGEETQDYIQNIEIQVDNFIKKKHRSTNDQDAIIKEIRDKVTSSNDRATLAVSHLDTFTVLFSSILEHLSIQNSLDRQDHEDRRSIALMGYRSQNQNYHNHPLTTELLTQPDGQSVLRSSLPGYPQAIAPQSSSQPIQGTQTSVIVNPGPNVIGVEKKCLSCSGQLSFVMSSFKMACLSYAPSPVMYRGRVYPREDMHYVRNELLNQAHDLLKRKLLVEEKNLSGKRFFDDAVLKLKGAVIDSSLEEPSIQEREKPAPVEALNNSLRLSTLQDLNQSVDETEMSQTILPKINQSTTTTQKYRNASAMAKRSHFDHSRRGSSITAVAHIMTPVVDRRKGSYVANLENLPGLKMKKQSVFLK